MKFSSAELAWHSFSQSYVSIVPWMMIWNRYGINWLMPVLPVCNYVSALPGCWCQSYWSPCVALLVKVAVRCIHFVPPRCILPFLWWLPLSSEFYELGGKRSWTHPMSWGQWFSVSALKCICWMWLSVPKGWSLWTSSPRQKWSALLHVRTPALCSSVRTR